MILLYEVEGIERRISNVYVRFEEDSSKSTRELLERTCTSSTLPFWRRFDEFFLTDLE